MGGFASGMGRGLGKLEALHATLNELVVRFVSKTEFNPVFTVSFQSNNSL